MAWGTWAAFVAASLALALIPGPGVATIVGFAFGSGRRAALAAVAGMAVGNALAFAASLAGAAAVLAASAHAFTLLKWAGALYLVFLGVRAIRRAGQGGGAWSRPPASPRAAFATTLAVGTFHPKTIMFFVAFAAQFISPSAAYLPQAAILVATFTAVAATTDAGYALAAARAARLLDRPARRRWLERAGGGVLIAAGVATAAVRR
ncbi:LysE family translocator [Sphingomonas corticis]|jgi:threonine/homoserine/homoserine lactone efflux protein|uniref:LysE family translocator n=1 Tax=Sphingomonas corticis TaxID=2722791 RepID=A0ABX1CSD4_9SPHN|nr:LysE family translocator [Sphingomonas corticis]NJR79210.1 LysE family translocator [Sphingomonas corticis]